MTLHLWDYLLDVPLSRIDEVSLTNERHLRRAGCTTLRQAGDLDRRQPYGLERAGVSFVGADRVRRLLHELRQET